MNPFDEHTLLYRIDTLETEVQNLNTNLIKLQETNVELIANIAHIQKNIGLMIDIIGTVTKQTYA